MAGANADAGESHTDEVVRTTTKAMENIQEYTILTKVPQVNLRLRMCGDEGGYCSDERCDFTGRFRISAMLIDVEMSFVAVNVW